MSCNSICQTHLEFETLETIVSIVDALAVISYLVGYQNNLDTSSWVQPKKPLIIQECNGFVLEWWYGTRKLSIYLDNDREDKFMVAKYWGGTEIEENSIVHCGSLVETFTPYWEWLLNLDD